MKDELLKHAKFVDFEKREVTFSAVEYFIHRFPHLEALREGKEVEALQEQFVLFQLLQDTGVPAAVWQEATVKVDDEVRYT